MFSCIYLKLFWQFFHVGLFSFGGGYATIPFLYDIAEKFHWYSIPQLTNMMAVSSITPGPVGINMATFAGFTTSGVLGSLIATFSIVLPSLIFVTIVAKMIDKFKENVYVKNVIKTLKPAGCALLSAVLVKLLFSSNLNIIGGIFVTAFVISACVKKLDPLYYLSISALIGVVCGYMHLIGV